mgnify:CR=1 FL=1
MLGVMFLMALFAWVVILVIKYMRKTDPGPGGWWGRGYKGPRPVGPPPKDPGPDPDGLLQIPYEWVEAHGKWAKQVVRESLDRIKVASGPH